MASERGESVAFTCAYAGNLRELASMNRLLESRSGEKEAVLPEELQILLNGDAGLFEDPDAKNALLADYTQSCRHRISGRHFSIPLSVLADDLERRAGWLTGYLRQQDGSTEGQTRDGLTATTITTDARWKVSSQ